MGYPHGTSLKILILLVVEIVCIDASSDAIGALKDMDPVTCTLEKECRIKTCCAASDNSNIERTRGYLHMSR